MYLLQVFYIGNRYKINNKYPGIFDVNYLICLNNLIIIYLIKYLLLINKKMVFIFLKLFFNY